MKIIKLVFIFLFLFSSIATADQWCMWDGSQGTGCQSDGRGYIRIPYPDGFKVSTPAIANAKGYYKVIVTQPVIGENQIKDSAIWGFNGSNITLTWSVRDLTTGEINQNTAQPMPLSEYYLWKVLITTGVITQQQAVNNLPQKLIDAYLARDRLVNP